MNRRRTIALAASVALTFAGAGVWMGGVGAQSEQPKRLVWRGHISDEDAFTGRSQSGGGVFRLPEPFSSEHQITEDYTFIQEFRPDGTSWWPVRKMSWTLRGRAGDDTGVGTCQGAGQLDLGPARDWGVVTNEQKAAMKADCSMKHMIISTHLIQLPESMPPPPVIPDVKDLDAGCEYRLEEGTRRTDVWLTPDFDAVVDLDTRPDSDYATFVPVPGRTVKLTAHTVPALPVRFKFVIDPDHTSHFSGYAGNAPIDPAFFTRYNLKHLAASYTDQSPDLIFDPRLRENQQWAVVQQDELETAEDSTAATAEIMAMDYGAIGQVRAYAKFTCGGWIPAEVRANGTVRQVVSVPLDEDHNFIADALHDYWNLKPDSDDDAEPEGDGTKGDGLTAFEEYRGFLIEGMDCRNPLSDGYTRTSPKTKSLFAYSASALADMIIQSQFAWASGLDTYTVCARHLYGAEEIVKEMRRYRSDDPLYTYGADDETRVVNFTLQRANQRSFDGLTISQQRPQHGVIAFTADKSAFLGGAAGMTISVNSANDMGPPRLTAAIVVRTGEESSVIHELGHALGVPHHSDSRRNWTLVGGVLDLSPGLADLQRRGIIPASEEGQNARREFRPDGFLVQPGPECAESDDASHAYWQGAFIGCLAQRILRRGQQTSGDVACPMRYGAVAHEELFHEPPGLKAVFDRSLKVVNTLTVPQFYVDAAKDLPDRTPAELFLSMEGIDVDAWSGPLRRGGDAENDRRTGQFCATPAGTGINTGAPNVAGDAGRTDGCRTFLVVNDLAKKDPK